MSTFASDAAPEPGDHVIPHASMFHFLFANDTILIFVTGMIQASMALLADLIVRSRADT